MPAVRLIALLLLVLTLAIGLVSCAGIGRSMHSGRGRLTLTVRWPATRDIPPATRSLKLIVKTVIEKESGVKSEGVTVAEKLVSRPAGASTSTATLEDLPSVDVRVRVLAFASADGSGTALASGFSDVKITENGTTSAAVTLEPQVAGCSEYSLAVDGQQRTSGLLPLDFHVGDDYAQASEFGAVGSVYQLGEATAHGKTYYRVVAPGSTEPFTLNVHYGLAVQNFNPGPERSASVTVTWPGGSKSLSATGTLQGDVAITVRDGDVLVTSGDVAVRTDDSNFAVYAAYNVALQDVPGGFFPAGLVRLNC